MSNFDRALKIVRDSLVQMRENGNTTLRASREVVQKLVETKEMRNAERGTRNEAAAEILPACAGTDAGGSC